MKANVFHAPGKFGLEEKPIPHAGPGEAVVEVRMTTICGTDIHIVRGEYPVVSENSNRMAGNVR
jgi:alcohol dehydrogenase